MVARSCAALLPLIGLVPVHRIENCAALLNHTSSASHTIVSAPCAGVRSEPAMRSLNAGSDFATPSVAAQPGCMLTTQTPRGAQRRAKASACATWRRLSDEYAAAPLNGGGAPLPSPSVATAFQSPPRSSLAAPGAGFRVCGGGSGRCLCSGKAVCSLGWQRARAQLPRQPRAERQPLAPDPSCCLITAHPCTCRQTTRRRRARRPRRARARAAAAARAPGRRACWSQRRGRSRRPTRRAPRAARPRCSRGSARARRARLGPRRMP